MKKLLLAVLAIAAIAGYFLDQNLAPEGADTSQPSESQQFAASPPSSAPAAATLLERAFAERRSNVQVQAQGVVVKTLPDDNQGSRHQRFIVELATGRTVLIVHNIDLAGRIDSLRAGDPVSFNGEYEWNDKGGLVHWTHRDPRGKHPAGWIKHEGRDYQ